MRMLQGPLGPIQGAATGGSRDTNSQLQTLAEAIGVPLACYIGKYVLGSLLFMIKPDSETLRVCSAIESTKLEQ